METKTGDKIKRAKMRGAAGKRKWVMRMSYTVFKACHPQLARLSSQALQFLSTAVGSVS